MEDAFLLWIKKVHAERNFESLDSERKTKKAIIERIFSYLGWDIHNIDEVYEEFPIPHETERVDYSLRYEDNNKVFIEVKKIGKDLENDRKQLMGYCSLFGVKLAVLTNGIIWWMYLPIGEGNFNQKKFCTIDLSDQKLKPNDIVNMFEKFLSKENVIHGKAVKSAENLLKSKQKESLVEKKLPEVWNKIVTEPNPILIKLITDTTEKLCNCKPTPEQVKRYIASRLSIPNQPIISEPAKSRRIRQSRKPMLERTDESDMTYTKPAAFFFKGERVSVSNWTKLLVNVSEKMYLLHKDNFSTILDLAPYFSTNPNRKEDLRAPRSIEGTNIFVETNMDANQKWDIARQIVVHFGHLKEDLQVELQK